MAKSSLEARRRDIFKQNFDQKMKERNLTKERLAELMRLDRDGRKWLTRVCRDGLARPNPATDHWLGDLSRHLGLVIGENLWDEQPQEHWYVSELRLVLADLAAIKEDLLGDRKQLDDEIERTISHWRERAEKLRKNFGHQQRLDAVLKLKATPEWKKACQIIAVKNNTPDDEAEVSQRFFNRAMRDGAKWAKQKIDQILSEQPAELTPAEALHKQLEQEFPEVYAAALKLMGPDKLKAAIKQNVDAGGNPDQFFDLLQLELAKLQAEQD